MTKNSRNEMIALASQLRTHPDIAGLDFIEKKIEAVSAKHGVSIFATLRHFLNGMRAIRSDQDELAIEEYGSCIRIASDGDYVLTAISHLLTATIHYEQERTELASVHFKAALANEHRLDTGTLSWILVNISGFYCFLGNYERALECASKGAELSSSSFNAYNYCVCLLNIGYAHTHLGRSREAVSVLEDAVEIGTKNNNSRLLAIAHSYLARSYASLDDCDFDKTQQLFFTARQYFTDALSVNDQVENEIGIARFYNKHARYIESVEVCDALFAQLSSELRPIARRRALELQCEALSELKMWERLAKGENQLRRLVSSALDEHETARNESVVEEVESTAEQQEQLINSKVFENLDAINTIGQMIATSDNLSKTLPKIYQQVNTVFPTFEFGIALYDNASDILDYCYFYDVNGSVKGKRVDCNKGDNLGAFVVNHLQTVHINSVASDTLSPFLNTEYKDASNPVVNDEECHSLLMTPIVLKNELLGVLSLRAKEVDQYHSYHRRLFEQLANFIGISLINLQQKARLLIANQQLEKLSQTDPLTGLRNRHQLSELFHDSLDSSVVNSTSFSLALIDIDYYKRFNDTYGHQMGDKALVFVANLLAEGFSDSKAHLFRYGGDEFLLLAEGLSQDALEHRLRSLLDNCYALHIDGINTPITLSVGAAIAECPERGTRFNLLFDLADEALYQIKNQGRNGYNVRTCKKEQLLSD
ncbi:sensor domain-containing diguanylate cyclase [Vibrio ulleungensis]|uniref:diguanylate cyclase n=1 Tax=Vibrio ulleungensis TaxID=2807619 RepID=A0ABS2HE16_9VIBR|nr:GGDEF domain-containing protein [Vibrio ulleungensis]MBM7035835.1 GGDEF domain-containing protein [Vibrio ulleungensis]